MAKLLSTNQGVPNPPQNAGDPTTAEVMPYVLDGIATPPDLARETTGWVTGVLPPAAQENWMRQNLWAWLARSSCVAAFTLRATKTVTIGGTLVAGNQVKLSFAGNDNTYTVTSADVSGGYSLVAQHWAAQLQVDPNLRDTLDFGASGNAVIACYRLPGSEYPSALTASVVSGTTTATVADLIGGSGATPLMVSTGPGDGDGLPFLHGGNNAGATTKLHYYGNAKEGAFRSGSFGSTQANAANVGLSSIAVGQDVTASGANSVAFGGNCVSSATGAVSAGNTNTASGANAVAMGTSNTVSGTNSVAFGSGNTANGSSSLAMGANNTVNQGSAIGTSNTVSASTAIALGTANTNSQNYATVIGYQGSPHNPGELAVSAGQFSSPGDAQVGFIVAKALCKGSGAYLVVDGSGSALLVPNGTSGRCYILSIDIAAHYDSGTGGGASATDMAYWHLQGAVFVNTLGVVTLSGLSGSPTAPTGSAGAGSAYRVQFVGGSSNDLGIIGLSNNANVTARFVASIQYTCA
jgi:hypothetical protein